VTTLETEVDLSSSFSWHSRKSFKNFIKSSVQSFVSSKLILSESFSSLTRTSINIADQILNARERSIESSLTSVTSSSFEVSSSVRSFSKFDFTPRSYEPARQTKNPVFSAPKEYPEIQTTSVPAGYRQKNQRKSGLRNDEFYSRSGRHALISLCHDIRIENLSRSDLIHAKIVYRQRQNKTCRKNDQRTLTVKNSSTHRLLGDHP
jgi:hypothetical protein